MQPPVYGPVYVQPQSGQPSLSRRPAVGPPEMVSVAYTLLAVFASYGLYVGLLYASVAAELHGVGGIQAAVVKGTSLVFEVIYGGSGLIGLLLIFGLRKGAKGAQVGATVLASLWTAYWAFTIIVFFGGAASTGLMAGQLRATGTVGSLAMLTLLAASGAVGALLWTPSAKRHFG
jgi:hypothetical protein